MKTPFALSLAFGLVGLAAQAGTYSYQASSIPLRDTVACHEAARTLTQIFSANPDLAYARGLCTAYESGLGTVRVEYESAAKAKITSTVVAAAALYTPWRYHTLSECEQRLVGQTTLFEQETGLKPFFAYCQKDAFSSREAFLPKIDAFGEGKKQPYLGGFTFFNTPKGITYTDFHKGLLLKLEAMGATLADLTITKSPGMNHANIHYYATAKQEFTHDEVATYVAREECELRKAPLAADLAKLERSPAFHYCGYVQVPGKWELNSVSVGPLGYSRAEAAETFDSLAACDASSATLKAFYEQQLGEKAVSALCTQTGKTARLVLFWTKE